MSFLTKIFGDETSRFLAQIQPIITQINALEEGFLTLSDEELRAKTEYLKKSLDEGRTVDDILPEAFAVVREAAKRTLKQRHYDVQLMGGIVLHKGNIAEMRTGEGKTLVATLPVYLNALLGKGVHVVTVNDYLARRDAVWMGQIYSFLGLTVGVINGQNRSYLYDPAHLSVKDETEADQERDETGSFKVLYEFLRPSKKSEAYRADITYGTNSEFGFDYLRDNTVYRKEDLGGRMPDEGGYHFAIIDEIDSILIDEARTPLIISMQAGESQDLYAIFAKIALTFQQEIDYELDEKKHAILLTDAGIEKAEKALGIENIYTDAGIKYVHHLETAVRAKALYKKDQQYVIRDGEIVIVDEFTGRLQPSRRWSEGLHQAIEAKEGVKVQQESRTFASITYQNYFRMYKKLSGMTGTAKTSAEEFYKVYGLEVVSVPTNKQVQRVDHNDLIFQTQKGKYTAIAKRVKELHEKGQPVLIGTVSIENNELLSGYLQIENVPHVVLNAKNHEHEGEIVAQAGQKGAVTVATNMAGRGVDIKLGGAIATPEEAQEVKDSGGLFVIGTERHDARRIDDQLRGRSGRQGDPGATQFYVSLDDQLMRVFASDTVKGLMGRIGIPEDLPIENPLLNRSLEAAQKKIEGLNFDMRKHVLEFDDVLNTQRNTIYERRKILLLGMTDDIEKELLEVIGLAWPDTEKTEEEWRQYIEDKTKEFGKEEFYEAVRRLMLQTIDMFWVEHLELMEYTRSSVSLRAYGQRDPLVEYQKEGLRLFREMQQAINVQILKIMPQIGAGALAQEEERLRKQRERIKTIGGDSTTSAPQAVRAEEKHGRNDIVTITNGSETKEVKYKKAEALIESGEWKIIA